MSGAGTEDAAEPRAFEYVMGEAEDGERLDRVLATLAGVPRAQVQRWVEHGSVTRNGQPARASHKVRSGDRLRAEPPEPMSSEVLPEALPLTILHEDDDLVVVDKPAGMVVHPAPGHASGTLVNALLHHCQGLAGIGGVMRPGIVHRLDRGTSGVMVAAKHDAAHLALSQQFHDHTIERVYLAFVRGVPGAETGHVARPIGRHHRDRKRMSVATRHGRDARTAWRVVARYPAAGVSLLEVRPETGRTHQIRVHLSHRGLPLVGDKVYGRARARTRQIDRPALHAAVLGFEHPSRGERLRFEAPLPADLVALRDALGAAA